MPIKLSLLLTGSELMNGDIIDTNSIMFANKLNEIGLSIFKKVTIGDDSVILRQEILSLTKTSDILIINGGLGPTSDDLTSEIVSQVASEDLVLNDIAHQHLQIWAKNRLITLNAPNLKQAYLPQSSTIIANKTGSAVGFFLFINQCMVICTPGVPSELKVMLKEEIIPLLAEHFPTKHTTNIHRIQLFGIGESTLQALINEHFPDWPNSIIIGYRSAMPLLELKLITETEHAHKSLPKWLKKLSYHIDKYTLASGEKFKENIAEYLVPLLIKHNKKITVAESCTGGLIASQITQVAGASAVFEAGYITYSNRIKTAILDVKQSTLDTVGAVSEETVIAMAKGAIKNSSADYVIAVSGIAGPDGGTEQKPVGSVWVAWGDQNNIQAKYFFIPKPRKEFQKVVAAISLNLIRRLILSI